MIDDRRACIRELPVAWTRPTHPLCPVSVEREEDRDLSPEIVRESPKGRSRRHLLFYTVHCSRPYTIAAAQDANLKGYRSLCSRCHFPTPSFRPRPSSQLARRSRRIRYDGCSGSALGATWVLPSHRDPRLHADCSSPTFLCLASCGCRARYTLGYCFWHAQYSVGAWLSPCGPPWDAHQRPSGQTENPFLSHAALRHATCSLRLLLARQVRVGPLDWTLRSSDKLERPIHRREFPDPRRWPLPDLCRSDRDCSSCWRTSACIS